MRWTKTSETAAGQASGLRSRFSARARGSVLKTWRQSPVGSRDFRSRALQCADRTVLGRAWVRQNGSTARNELKRTQELVLDVLRADTATPLTRARYQEIAGVSRSQAAYDLAELVEAGIVERVGAGPATRYRLVDSRPDDRRRWTNERIRSALQEFCAEREAWPSAREFKEGGRHDLYVAASRYGGVAFWAKELGFARPGRPLARTSVPVGPRPRRLRLRWTAEAADSRGRACGGWCVPASPVGHDQRPPAKRHLAAAGARPRRCRSRDRGTVRRGAPSGEEDKPGEAGQATNPPLAFRNVFDRDKPADRPEDVVRSHSCLQHGGHDHEVGAPTARLVDSRASPGADRLRSA